MSHSAICIQDLEDAARQKLSKMVLDYFYDGSENGTAHQENMDAFGDYKIRPRVLRDVSKIDTRTSLFGTPTNFPLAIAPSGMQCLAHPEGEKATARAAARAGICVAVSTFATTSLEDVKKAGDAAKGEEDLDHGSSYMLQVYVFRNRRTTEQLVKRAEDAGYKAILLTCDTPRLGNRYNMARNNFCMPSHLALPNFGEQKVGPLIQKGIGGDNGSAANGQQVSQPKENENDDSITWEETLPWLRSITNMEIWLKGITTKEDVEIAIRSAANISGIVVSNHGGRQLESALSTLESLEECVKAATSPTTGEKRCQVWMDGGICKGSDIFKALALGADGVFVGRAPLWGLAVDGEEGVGKVLEILKAEFQHTMALAGCRSLADITRAHLTRVVPRSFSARL